MDADTRFYKEHKDKLFAYLMRLTRDWYWACDLLQDSFVRYLERYRHRPPSVPLLYTIARNAFVDGCRKRKPDGQIAEDRAQGSEADNPEHRVLVREQYQRVTDAMETLSEAEQETLSLAVTGDLSYREIATILKTTEANVKVRVHRARMKLLERLRKGETDG
jgi:RNA polymerase sigma-70 factor (ECF subfamily)